MKANKSGGLSCEVQNFSASSEVKLEIAPLDSISKQADKAHAHEAVPMIYLNEELHVTKINCYDKMTI